MLADSSISRPKQHHRELPEVALSHKISGKLWRFYFLLKQYKKFFQARLPLLSNKNNHIISAREAILCNTARIKRKGINLDWVNLHRPIYEKSTDPQPNPTKHVFFTQHVGKVTLLGQPLIPCLSNRRLTEEAFSCVRYDNAKSAGPECKVIIDQESTVLVGKYYSLIGHWTITPNYYHWLMDVLPMTELMDDQERKILIRSPRSEYEKQTLQELGLWERCVTYDGDHARVTDFTFVSHPSWSVSYNPESVAYLRNVFQHLFNTDGEPLKIFVSRKGSVREAYNESELEDYFSERGWYIFNGSAHSFQEQVELFSRAKEVCGIHGAGLTNTLWCQRGTKVTEIFADNWLVHSNENIILINELNYHPIVLPGGWNARVHVPLESLDL